MLAMVTSFLRAPTARKLRLLEASVALSIARILTCLPMRFYSRICGIPQKDTDTLFDASHAQIETARVVGSAVQRAAAVVPFKALCMEQAIAARIMLRLRAVPGTVYIGVHRDPVQRVSHPSGANAHAWLEVGETIVVGGPDVFDYVPLAAFR
ncbi:Transglutaminase-like superfamily protein [Aliiruegeria lutimaris]|uniref:Transglutaminase-like superfamily protein n=2 Tax=Aliiruegeria lutimaris TaxID=571298 RepID=A0A1G9DTU8_9RHOB|nr:Transglutaminase-like superfamily protein [Aliiruegeria lutimaris]